MAKDDMKRWLEEVKNMQPPHGLSHARTKPIVVEKLKTRSRRSPNKRPKEESARDSDD